MNGVPRVEVDLEAGEVRLGGRRVRLIPGAAPVTFSLDDPGGPVLRALRFEERTRLLAGATPTEVALCLAGAALVAPGAAPEGLRVAVSLALAGGAEEAPPFSVCAALAARQDGWDGPRVCAAPALVVDRLVGRIVGQEPPPSPDDGWTRFVFPGPDADLDGLIADMVENLCRRSAGGVREPAEEEPEAAPAPGRRVGAAPCPDTEGRRQRFSFRLAPPAGERAPTALATGPSSSSRPPRPIARPAASSPTPPGEGAMTTTSPSLPATPEPPAATALVVRRDGQGLASHARPSRPSSRVLAAMTGTASAPPGAAFRAAIGGEPSQASPSTAVAVPEAAGPEPTRGPRFDAPRLASSWVPPDRPIPAEAFPRVAGAGQTPRASGPTPNVSPGAAPANWLDELALLLEAECDLRGLDP
jgi:hypothetical protein